MWTYPVMPGKWSYLNQTRNTLSKIIELGNCPGSQQNGKNSSDHSLQRSRPKIVIGTKTGSEDKFKVFEQNKMLWLHVSKFKPQLSSEELENYLKTNLKTDDIIVEKLTRNPKEAVFSSFKIGAPIDLMDILFSEHTWF